MTSCSGSLSNECTDLAIGMVSTPLDVIEVSSAESSPASVKVPVLFYFCRTLISWSFILEFTSRYVKSVPMVVVLLSSVAVSDSELIRRRIDRGVHLKYLRCL